MERPAAFDLRGLRHANCLFWLHRSQVMTGYGDDGLINPDEFDDKLIESAVFLG